MAVELSSIGNLIATPEPPASPPSGDGSFASQLEACQSPPKPEAPPPESPPPTQSQGEKELQTNEPNAQSPKPDLSSQTQNGTNASTDNEGAQTQKAVNASSNGAASKADEKGAESKGKTDPNGQIVQTPDLAAALALNLSGQAAAGSKVLPANPASKSTAAIAAAPTGSDGKNTVSLSELPVSPQAAILSAKAAPTAPGARAVAAAQETPPITAAPTSDQAAPAKPGEAEPSHAQPPTPASPSEPSAANPTPTTTSASTTAGTPATPPPSSQVSTNAGPVVTAGGTPTSVETKQGGRAPTPGSGTLLTNHAGDLAHSGANLANNSGNQGSQSNSQSFANPGRQQGEDVVRQVAEHVDKLVAAKAVENVTVHLQSDDDTNVMLNVKTSHAGVQAQIVTNSEGLRSALHQNRQDLDRAFQTKGMNLGQLSVGLKDGGKREQEGRQAFRSGSNHISTKASSPAGSTRQLSKGGIDLEV